MLIWEAATRKGEGGRLTLFYLVRNALTMATWGKKKVNSFFFADICFPKSTFPEITALISCRSAVIPVSLLGHRVA